MQLSEDLRNLAARMHCGDTNNPQRVRETLEASLVPLIRCAIRSGTGVPALVTWVRRHLPEPSGSSADAARAAPSLARLLCSTLLGQASPEPPRQALCDTVVGP
jgi:hypothetical protein